MNPSLAIMGAGVLISASIYFREQQPEAHYQITSFGPAMVARLETRTGRLSLCGRLQDVEDLKHRIDTGPSMLRDANITAEQLKEYKRRMEELEAMSRCFVLDGGALDK